MAKKKRKQEDKGKALSRRRERYALCIELGFTSNEASILAGKAEAYLRELAMGGKTKLKLLEKRVLRRNDRINERRRERYALCKKLGIPSDIAKYYCGKSEKDIRALANEHKRRGK